MDKEEVQYLLDQLWTQLYEVFGYRAIEMLRYMVHSEIAYDFAHDVEDGLMYEMWQHTTPLSTCELA